MENISVQNLNRGFHYSDIFLVPQYSELRTRSEADTSVEFLDKKFKLPIVPANMVSVVDEKIAHWLSENDYFYIYHRFGDTYNFVKKANLENWKNVSISIGVKREDKELIEKFIFTYIPCLIDFITIDIAHGHHILVKEMIEHIKDVYSKCTTIPLPKIIVGNVCTPEAVEDLEVWGADAIKVGIAGGGACSTKNQTGFHIPMFTAIQQCSAVAHVPIIGDGGIKENGDIAKALVAGASVLMCGSTLAACKDSPAENIFEQDAIVSWGEIEPKIKTFSRSGKVTHKRYFGSASYKNKNENRHIEGFEIDIPCNGMTYKEKYQEIKESLQSSISYAGGEDLNAFKNTKWITII